MLGTRTAQVLLVLAFVSAACAQPAPIRIGPGVTPPRLTKKVEPSYSPLARADRIQGTVLLQLVVTEKGRTSKIEVISPLGFGLDEKAVEAIEQWEFTPGLKQGMPVAILATVEVNFRFVGLPFDGGYEQRRTKYNLALRGLQRNGPKTKEDSVNTMLALAKQNFPAALYLVGKWEIEGENNQPKDARGGLAKVQKAAEKRFAPAIYEIAMQSINDASLRTKALEKMKLASTLGSQGAQSPHIVA